MANEDMLRILRQGVAVWNTWRIENPVDEIDLSEANFHKANLMWANLHDANLKYADFSGADLHGAELAGAEPPSWNKLTRGKP